jgi:hypothetical protein
MGQQSDAIDCRLEGLKLDDRRSPIDGKPWPVTGPNSAVDEPAKPIERVIVILEELTRRIEGLEKKNHTLGHEIRHRGREDRRWRSLSLAGGLIISMLLYLGGLFHWI